MKNSLEKISLIQILGEKSFIDIFVFFYRKQQLFLLYFNQFLLLILN